MCEILSSSIKDNEVSLESIFSSDMLPVIKYPNKILRKKSLIVKAINSSINELVHRMIRTMYDTNGVGLAAPQVGKNLNLFVIDTTKECNSPMVFINPEILWLSEEKELKYEGCLSVFLSEELKELARAEAKEKRYGVERSLKAKIRYQDLSGKWCELSADSLLAHCIQHENDHLMGVVYIDKIQIVDPTIKAKFDIEVNKNTIL